MSTRQGRFRWCVALTGSRLARLAIAVALGAAGCGDDGDTGSASGSGVEADSSQEEATCSPVGEELAAKAIRTISIELQEYAFSPSTVQVNAGVVTFAAKNSGSENHELAFLPGGGEVLLTTSGEPDEDALAKEGAFELEAFSAGQSCNATYDVKPGTYTLFCVVTSTDGKTHYEKGMRGELVVG